MSTHSQNIAAAITAVIPGVVAVAAVLGGLGMLYDLIVKGLVSPDAGLAIIGPVIGAAVAYVFGQQTISRTAQAVTNGVATAAVKAARAENERTP